MINGAPSRRAAQSLLADWKGGPFTWPRLFWTAEESSRLHERVRAVPGFVERVTAAADRVIGDPAIFAQEPAWQHRQTGAIITLGTAAWVTGQMRMVSLATRLMDRAASAETWASDVRRHRPSPVRRTTDKICYVNDEPPLPDAGSAGTGATIAYAMDLLAGKLTDDQIIRYREAVQEHCLEPFRAASRPSSPSSIRSAGICGDTGLAALGTSGAEDDVDDLLTSAVEGVTAFIRRIPAAEDITGSPRELIAELGPGLRFLAAVQRLSPTASEHLSHPHLARVCEYFMRVGVPTETADDRAFIFLLARAMGRSDLAARGRTNDVASLAEIVFDEPR